tara:strand:- start:694 stop:948 length:255 start_codon:yes stop_codon:yes gene_type:complete
MMDRQNSLHNSISRSQSDIYHFPITLKITNIKSMAVVIFLTILHGISDFISVLLGRSEEIQHVDWSYGKPGSGTRKKPKACELY